MRTRAATVLLAILTISPVLAFTDIESTPFSLFDQDGRSLYWNRSYRITVDEMEIRLVLGPTLSNHGGQPTSINWDPEIVSITVENDDIMRRVSFGGGVENDPITSMPFLGIGGLASPQNYISGIDPTGVPAVTFDWVEEGENGIISWTCSYTYSPGDQILWLNRTYTLNSTLHVECEYWVASEYQAVQQRVTVTNGGAQQLLPFPLESAFSLGSKLSDRGISLPDTVIHPGAYFTYPAGELPSGWFNQTTDAYHIPQTMWEEGDLPGMLYMEFDVGERDWYGVSGESDLSFEILTGVGVKVLSMEGFTGFRPYCIFFSGPRDHVLMGFKPFGEAGPYDDFVPMNLNAGQKISVDLLWFFPEPVEGKMSTSVLDSFGELALGVPEYHELHSQAKQLFEEAKSLAAEGDIAGATERADQSIEKLGPLGELSSAVEEEARTINLTKNTWISASADPPPKDEAEGRPAMIYSLLVVVALILIVFGYIYIIEPRRSPPEE